MKGWAEKLTKQHALVRLKNEWADIRKEVLVNFGPNTDPKIPHFVRRFAKQLHNDGNALHTALMNGDLAWFVAWSMRLDQIEHALNAIDYDEQRRLPLTRARWLLQRLSVLANHRLKELGGSWPINDASSQLHKSSDLENHSEPRSRRIA